MTAMLSVSLNGDKPGRAKQERLGDCKSMAALFAEIARGWKNGEWMRKVTILR